MSDAQEPAITVGVAMAGLVVLILVVPFVSGLISRYWAWADDWKKRHGWD